MGLAHPDSASGPSGLRVMLAGASGLIGQHLLARLSISTAVSTLVVPARRVLPEADARVHCLVSPMDSNGALDALDAELARVAPALDVFISCLGTTFKVAGSKPAFLAVDRDLVLRLAQSARKRGARHALLVSSVGASAQSGNFYLRVKGETERLLAAQGFERLDILRPGLLLGERAQSRPGEALAQRLLPWFNPLMKGALGRYRGIHAAVVAHALQNLLDESTPGQQVLENDAIEAAAARSG